MAYEKKKDNSGLINLKSALTDNALKRLYVFHGEENYLLQYYLGRIRKLCAGAFEDFDIVALEGEQLTAQILRDAIDSVPMGAVRKLVTVRNYQLFAPTGDLKEAIADIISNLPDYICLIFYFDGVEFKCDKRLVIYKSMAKYCEIVEFNLSGNDDLIPWIKRRFSALGKEITTDDCEYLIFICGASMTNLATETEKLAAGTVKKQVTKSDIDALASRVLEAEIFGLTDCIIKKQYSRGLLLLRDLLDMKNEPVAILGAITRQMQRLYGARLAFERRMGERELMKLLGFTSSYPAQLLLQGARSLELSALRHAQQLCLDADQAIKSNNGDPQRTLEILIMSLSNGGK